MGNVKQRKIKSVRDLKVYNTAYQLAMEIFKISRQFPKEEVYSLTDQARRSSRSAAINIREGFAKRRYKHVFISLRLLHSRHCEARSAEAIPSLRLLHSLRSFAMTGVRD